MEQDYGVQQDVEPPSEASDEHSGRLGDILVSEGFITAEQLQQALEHQRASGMKLGDLLLSYNWITEESIARALSVQYGHHYIGAIDVTRIDPSISDLIPARMVREQLVFPYEREGNILRIIMTDPTNLYLLDDIKLITGYQDIEIYITTPTYLRKALADFYDATNTMSALLGQMDEDEMEVVADEEESVNAAELRAQVEDTPIIKMVNLIIKEALKSKATDIHLEPYEHSFRVRYRIDGMLTEVPSPPKKYQGAVISRVKIMADLDIAERRMPQDGRFKLRLAHKEVDFRISTLPTVFGEKVVMRILDKSGRITDKTGTLADMEPLGFGAGHIEILKRTIYRPYGMIIVCGPTGSGKTTTLYTILEILNNVNKNILTVEDPVEYMIPGINQVATRAQIGLTFAHVLRSILRQDPDIVMLGEIRDQETAEIAINASLTGHLVLSTLHTNDAPGAIVRLDNMGIEPFLVTSSLLLIVSQRLMRKICSTCREEYQPSEELLAAMQMREGQAKPVFYRGRGCDECNHTGYRGRVGVYELLEMTEDVKVMVLKRASSTEIKAALLAKGFKTLRSSSLDVVLQGLTTLEELWRVSTEDYLAKE